MGILVWLIVGFFAGLIARALMPGRQAMGMLGTTLLGMVGSLIGGLIGSLIYHRPASEFSAGGLILSVLGAMLCLFILRAAHRPMQRTP